MFNLINSINIYYLFNPKVLGVIGLILATSECTEWV